MKGRSKKRARSGKQSTPLKRRKTKLEREKVDQTQMGIALREWEDKYRALLEQSLQGTVVVQDSRIVFANNAFAQISGYTPEELLSLSPRKVKAMIHPDDQALVWGHFWDRLVGKPVSPRYEYRGIRKDGTVCWLEMFASRIVYDGKPAIQGSVIDITARKRAAAELIERERRFRDIAENACEWIWEVDARGRYSYSSPAVEKILGYKPEEVIGKHFYDLFHPEDRAKLKKMAFQSFSKKECFRQFVNRNVHKNGKTVWLSTSGVPVLDGEGNLLGYRGADTDISERREAEKTLLDSEKRFRDLVENLSDVIYSVDKGGVATYISPAVEAMLGYSPSEIVGRSFAEFIQQEDLPACVGGFRKVLSGHANTGEYRILTKRGEVRWVHTSNRPVYDGDHVIGAQGVLKDITERKQAAEVQSVLLRISQGANVLSSLPELLGTIREELRAVIDTTNFYVALYEKESDDYSFPYCVDEHEETDVFTRQQLKKSLTDYVRRTGSPLLVDQHVHRQLLQKGEVELVGTPSKIWLGVPLRTTRGTIGVVAVQSYTDENAYSEQDVELLSLVSDNIALVIERKWAEDKLRESEQQYRRVFELCPEVIGIIDREGTLLDVNARLYDFLEYKPEEVIGKNFLKLPFLPDDSKKVAMQRLSESVGGGKNDPYDLIFTTKSGKKRVGKILSSLIKNEANETVGELVMASDITEQKQGEAIQSALYRIADVTNSTLHMQEFYAAIHSIVGELMYAGNFYIALYDSSAQLLSFPYFVDEFDPPPEPKKLGKGLTEYVLRTGEPLLANPKTYNDMISQGKIEVIGSPSVDWLGVPLKRGKKTFGVLVVQSYRETTRFGNSEKELLMFVSQHIATALERKRAKEALGESEEKFRSFVETSPDLVFRLSKTGRIEYVSPRVGDLYGYKPDELIGKHLRVTTPAEEIPKTVNAFKLIYAGKPVKDLEIRQKDKMGRVVPMEVNAVGVKKDGKIVGIQGIMRDITTRKRLEAKFSVIHNFSKQISTILKVEDVLNLTLDVIEKVLGFKYCAVHLVDGETRELYNKVYRGFSKRFKENFRIPLDGPKGVTAWAAREGKSLIVPDVKKDKRYLTGSKRTKSEMVVPLKVGDEIFGVIDIESPQPDAFREDEHALLSTLASYVAVAIKNSLLFKDLGEAKAELEKWNLQLEDKVRERTRELEEAQEQLLGSERLATIGQLAASIGHELRNPLGVVHNCLYLLDLKLKDADEKVKKQLVTMQRELLRSDKIISDLLEFSRNREPSLVPTDVNQVIEESLSKVNVVQGVEVVKQLKDIPTVKADGEQLQSVFINLMSNGIQAMPEGGTLTLKTNRNSEFVKVEISDTGVGMSKENLKRIFEPLFTTKSKGIGLGLSVTKRFIDNHGGTIEVKSKPNAGSTFVVRLPIEREG